MLSSEDEEPQDGQLPLCTRTEQSKSAGYLWKLYASGLGCVSMRCDSAQERSSFTL